MSEQLEQAIDYMSNDAAQYIHDHMQSSMEQAYAAFPGAALVMFVISPSETGTRIAHMSNMDQLSLVEVIKEWVSNQENFSERDRAN